MRIFLSCKELEIKAVMNLQQSSAFTLYTGMNHKVLPCSALGNTVCIFFPN